jgi:hypothetical protein
MIKNKIITILIIIFISSCESMPETWDWGMQARPLTGVRNFPPSDTDYGKGFKDGCESTLSVVGKGWVDATTPKMNPVLMTKNPDYASGWWDGHEQCTYILDWDVL